MKKILLLLAALSAVTFGADSTGVHNSVYGNNQIDVETKAFIVNAGLVITASEGDVDSVPTDAIKKAILDHGTLMAGSSADSIVDRTVYIRKTNGKNFPSGTVLNIALNADPTRNNELVNVTDTTAKLPHVLDATIGNANYNEGSGNSTNGGQTLSLNDLNDGDFRRISAGDFLLEPAKNNVSVNLKSTINSTHFQAVSKAEGAYTNTSTLAVRFSKIPGANGSAEGTPLADYTTAGNVETGSNSNETAGIKADGTPAASVARRR